MKKIFFLFCLVFSLCSCTTMKIANITAFQPNGEILCEYKNICLDDNAFKSFGLNFYDGRRYVVLPNSLPYKVEYIYTTKTDILIKKRHPITFPELKEMFTRLYKTKWFALVYDLTDDFKGTKFNGRVYEYVEERNIYEQVEFFDNIDTLHERIEELKRISNKNYSNFRIHKRETFVK